MRIANLKRLRFGLPLSQKGFSHHLLLPIVAILAVGSIGAYLTFASKAATVCPSGSTYSKSGDWNVCEFKRYVNLDGYRYCGSGRYAASKQSDGQGDWIYNCKSLPTVSCFSGQNKVFTYPPDANVHYVAWTCQWKDPAVNPNPPNPKPPTISKTCTTPHPSVKSGAPAGCIAHAQDNLTKAGFATTVDGVWGSGTESSIKAFQKKYGLTVDGVLGKTDWDYLHKAASGQNPVPPKPVYLNLRDKAYGCASPRATIQLGSKGNCVRYLQYAMNHYAYDTKSPRLSTSGTFDAKTKDAVVSFQKRFKKTADGVAGSSTWSGIDYLLGKYPDEHARYYSCEYGSNFSLPVINTIGARSGCAKYLQWALIKDGFKVDINGTFDSKTQTAVKAFQTKHKLTSDGAVGAATWSAIMDVSKNYLGLAG
jgi:peptidoglycan hydrolase-like protein with peptidoglycan-binding domain